MNNAVQIVNPIGDVHWNDLVLASKNASFFHSSNWAQVLSDSYNYTPLFISLIHDSMLQILLPFMEVNSRLTGKRAVSLPFTDYCDPIITEYAKFDDLLNILIDYGKKSGWMSFEFRTTITLLSSACPPSSNYCGHSLDLSRTEEEIYTHLRDSTKRNINKALKEGVKISFDNSVNALKEFYRLNCITRREHGLPPQPYDFFKKVHEHVLSKDLGYIVLASHNGKNIAGAVYFYFGNRAYYKYGASDRTYHRFRANNLVMWEAIRYFLKKRCESLTFGRTELENRGLLQFKNGWGAQEYPIYYYKYDLRQNTFVKDTLKLTGMHNKIFRKMPIPLLKMAGSILYRHMG